MDYQPSDLAEAYKKLVRGLSPVNNAVTVSLVDITAPLDNGTDNGTGFPPNFGDWFWDR
jgi:hypothetical protein